MDAYIYQADFYCEDCISDLKKEIEQKNPEIVEMVRSGAADSNDYPQGPYSDGGGEADSPQHCGACRAFLHNPITEVGENFVIEVLGKFLKEGDQELGGSYLAREMAARFQTAGLSDFHVNLYTEWAEEYDYVLEQEASRRFPADRAPSV